MLYRSCEIREARVDTEKRTVALSFSSEVPVDRYFGAEILDHSPASVDMARIRSGAPLLLEHNRADMVGVVESAQIDPDKVGRAVVRFGKSARAEEIFQDVQGGIRRLVSVGYRVRDMELQSENEGLKTYRVTRWEPMEISIVAVPADHSVGIGRAEDGDQEQINNLIMKASNILRDKEPSGGGAPAPEPVNIEIIREKARAAIQEQNKEIQATVGRLEKRWPEVKDLGLRAMAGEMTLADFREKAFAITANAKPLDLVNPNIGMSERDLSRYSFQRAVIASATGKLDGLELECHDAAAKKLGRPLQGDRSVLVPWDVLAYSKRDQLVGTGSIGGNLVATNLLASSFIEVLRNRMLVARLGATMLTGLVGNVAIPRQGAAAAISWQASEAATHTEGSITLQQVTLQPKQIAAKVDYSWLLLAQSTPQIDEIIRRDLTAVIARGIDLGALHGTGTSGQPTGLISQAGVGSVALGTNGGTINWAGVVSLETAVATANADVGSLAYLTNAKQRGNMKTVERTSATGIFLWQDGQLIDQGIGMVNGYPAGVSNQVASNLTKGTATTICSAIFFGDWSSLLIGMWGGLELLANPYAQTQTRIVELHAWQFVDVACRHGESFAVIADAL